MPQPNIKHIQVTNLTNQDGSTRTIVIGLGDDNKIYNWRWAIGAWELDAKKDDGGAF